MKIRYKAIPAVFLLLMKDNKILLQRRFHTGYEDGKYSFVSGHVDEGETPTQALVREAKEEAGIIIHEKDLRFIHFMYRKGTDGARCDMCFTTDVWEGEPQIMEKDKADDIGWFDIDNLPESIDFVYAFVRYFKDGTRYSEFGWD